MVRSEDTHSVLGPVTCCCCRRRRRRFSPLAPLRGLGCPCRGHLCGRGWDWPPAVEVGAGTAFLLPLPGTPGAQGLSPRWGDSSEGGLWRSSVPSASGPPTQGQEDGPGLSSAGAAPRMAAAAPVVCGCFQLVEVLGSQAPPLLGGRGLAPERGPQVQGQPSPRWAPGSRLPGMRRRPVGLASQTPSGRSLAQPRPTAPHPCHWDGPTTPSRPSEKRAPSSLPSPATHPPPAHHASV